VAGWPAGGRALPGMGVVGWMPSVRKDGRRASGVKKGAGKVPGMVKQRGGSDWGDQVGHRL